MLRFAKLVGRTVMGVALTLSLVINPVFAGGGNFRNSSVGGVSVDANGVLDMPSVVDTKNRLDIMRRQMGKPSTEQNLPVQRRMVSLKGLEAALADAMQNNQGQIPDEVRYLAGLQRIEFVFVYPKTGDVVIAGPAEGWTLNDSSEVVGVTTGRPVLLLDDLLVAFRTTDSARNGGISCSIEPTQEGQQRLQKLLSQQRGGRVNTKALEPAMKEAFGPQLIKLSNVPESSHFARVLVAADYRMKRLAMGLDKAPVKDMASYLTMLKSGTESAAGANPRWWMACNYQPMARSTDKLSWQLRGPGVKAMTEDGFVGKNGIQGTGKKSPLAQQWADNFTSKYAELSSKDVVFGQLRNVMDMCVIAALIQREGLMDTAGLSAPILTGKAGNDLIVEFNSPKTVVPHCSFLRIKKGWLVTASGGVQIDSWA
ncbi:MAG: hypothetical protein ACI9HK_002941, partial [Pirellulaceae bacterium]